MQGKQCPTVVWRQGSEQQLPCCAMRALPVLRECVSVQARVCKHRKSFVVLCVTSYHILHLLQGKECPISFVEAAQRAAAALLRYESTPSAETVQQGQEPAALLAALASDSAAFQALQECQTYNDDYQVCVHCMHTIPICNSKSPCFVQTKAVQMPDDNQIGFGIWVRNVLLACLSSSAMHCTKQHSIR